MKLTDPLPSLPSFTSLSRTSSSRSIPPPSSLSLSLSSSLPASSLPKLRLFDTHNYHHPEDYSSRPPPSPPSPPHSLAPYPLPASPSASSPPSSPSAPSLPPGIHSLEQRAFQRPPASSSFFSSFDQEAPAAGGCGVPREAQQQQHQQAMQQIFGGAGGSGATPPPPPPPPPTLLVLETLQEERLLQQLEHEDGGGHTQECQDEARQTRTCYYLSAPFRREVWADFLFFLIIAPLVTAFQLAWTLVSLLLGLAFTILIPPMGLAMLCLAAATWRQLARFDLLLLSLVGRTWQKVPPLPSSAVKPVWDRGVLKFIWEWSEVLLGSPTTWVCALNFILLKPLMVAAWLAALAAALFLSLVLVLNLILTLASTDTVSSEDWSSLSGFEWIINTPAGSVVTIPLGLLIFWGTTVALIPLGRFYKRAVIAILTNCERTYRQF